MSEALTIPHLAVAAAKRWPDQDAIVDGDRRTSFAELAELMRAAAAAFVAAGLQEGERAALWAENSTDWVVACLGLQAAGGVLVPLNTRFRATEVGDIVERSAASMAVGSEEFLGERYAEILQSLDASALRRVVALGGADWQEFLDAASDTDREEADRRLSALQPTALCDIMFTSGTTGAPKGVMSTHEQTVRTAALWARATTITAGDRFLILWPFFHCSGYKAGWVVNLAVGATTLPEAQLDVSRLTETVAREKVTFLPGPPTLFQTLLADPNLDRSALTSLRVSITGAASVAPSMIEAMRNDLKIPIVLTGYGLTETCGTVTMSSPDDPPEIITQSCGRVIEGIEIKLVDDDGQEVTQGESGEVLVRGMNVMQGYLDDPEATAETIDADGWLKTGDLATMNEDGYLQITGRSKDVFMVGGFNCYPAEIENMMMAHTAILHVAVTGVPDERMGEVGKAWIVLKEGAKLTKEELVSWSRDRMANFKVPRHITFMGELPTNSTGKVQKFRLGEEGAS